MYMAANGRRQNPRKQVGADPVRGGNADKREPGTARTAATAECKPSPGRQCRQEFFGEFRKTGEISRFNLWRLISCAVRRKQVEPGTARTAEASGCRHCRPGGSKWNRALPGRRKQVGAGSVCWRQCRPIICGEAHRFEDFGNFNLWFPKSSAIPRRRCVQAQPARTELTEVTS